MWMHLATRLALPEHLLVMGLVETLMTSRLLEVWWASARVMRMYLLPYQPGRYALHCSCPWWDLRARLVVHR